MRDAIQNLAKAAVTALIKSDPSVLAIEGGKLAIDRLFGWLPQKGKLDALIARVEGELERLADVEFKGRADLEPAIGNATILFETFGLTAIELVDLSLKPERATAELLARGKEVLRAAGEAVAGLCRGRIVPRVYELLLSDPQTIAELSPAITQALLSQREAIDRLPDEVGLALRRMLGRHPVIDPTEIWRPGTSDIHLLRAEYGVVPFHEQRRPEVERLLAWCEADAPTAVRVVTGAGGTGKTRLMIELCKEARLRRWRAGFLHRETPVTPSWELDGLVEGEALLLLVVDYAETKRDMLVPVLRRLTLDHASPKTRVILVARAVSDWLPDLRRADPKLQELLDETKVEMQALSPIALPMEQRGPILEAAAAAYAERLPVAEVRDRRPSAAGIDLSARHFANALFLHIAALAAVVGDPAKEANGLLRFVLVREERHWRKGLESAELRQDVDVQSVEQAEALITLAGGADNKAEARELLGRVPHLSSVATPKRDRLIDLLHRLYPGERYLEPLRPDLLGEELVDRALGDDPELLEAAFGKGVSGLQIQNGLTVLTRLAQRRPHAERWLEQALVADVEGLAPPAIQVAIETGHPMGRVLLQTLRAQPLREPSRLEPLIPERTTELLKVAVLVIAQQRHRMQALPKPWADDHKAEVARIANNLANRLGATGQREAALTSAHEAADLYRELAAKAPEAWRPDLAKALNNLAIRLSGVGQREAALTSAQEAADVYRELAAKAPNPWLPALARALHTLAIRLGEGGQHKAARARAQEAADLFRALAAKVPDAFRPDLALALNNLAIRLKEGGQHKAALARAQEAADLFRALAAKAPDAYRPDLAGALNNLAYRQSEVGQHKAALATAKEAADLYRVAAAKAPDAFRPALAMGLNTLAIRLSEVGQREAALADAQEATDLYRDLAAKAPDAHRPDLASALSTLASCLSEVGQREVALAAAQEVVAIRRELAAKAPDAFRPALAGSLATLANCLEANGDVAVALERNREAIEIYRPYLLAQPSAFMHWMAPMCRQYVERCEKLGRDPDEALLAPIAAVLQEMQEGSGDDA